MIAPATLGHSRRYWNSARAIFNGGRSRRVYIKKAEGSGIILGFDKSALHAGRVIKSPECLPRRNKGGNGKFPDGIFYLRDVSAEIAQKTLWIVLGIALKTSVLRFLLEPMYVIYG